MHEVTWGGQAKQGLQPNLPLQPVLCLHPRFPVPPEGGSSAPELCAPHPFLPCTHHLPSPTPGPTTFFLWGGGEGGEGLLCFLPGPGRALLAADSLHSLT